MSKRITPSAIYCSFSDKTSYLQMRAAWRAQYNLVIQVQREQKKLRSNHSRKFAKAEEGNYAPWLIQRQVEKISQYAAALLEARAKMKELAEQQYQQQLKQKLNTH